MDIKKIAYEKYKLDWLMNHGYTLTDLINELDVVKEDEEDNDSIGLLFSFWEDNCGFGSEIWVCYQEFINNEYADANYMKQILTRDEYQKYQEDLNMNNRINAIAEFAKRRDVEKMTKEMELLRQAEECKTKIRALEPRIDELLEVGNACVKNNIPLEGSAWGGHEGYDTHQFITNRWSHLVGFVDRKNGFAYLGIDAGGACGKYDFRTNGIDIYDVHEETKEKIAPSLYHMVKFLEKFDEFEKEFYAYVDKVCKSK